MKKDTITIIVLVFVFLIGLSLLLYPTVADYLNSKGQIVAIKQYEDAVGDMKSREYKAIIKDANDFNATILNRENTFVLPKEDVLKYNQLLNLTGYGVMGYIEIPAIKVRLPIYHGTEDSVLQAAVGHVEWSSLPVGGESTHCIISGHRGLPSATLFTHLDKLVEGDIFTITVLNETLTYEVDKISIVEPEDSEPLQVVKGKDYCTLLTCTPYGINTQRLLVRGHRIENAKEDKNITITSEAIQIEPMIVSTVIGVPVLILLIILEFIKTYTKTNRSVHNKEE